MRRVEEGKRMNAIQIFSSRPILAGRNAAGVYKKTRKIELPEVVELTILENFYATTPNINHAVFWSAGKFACYLANPIPFRKFCTQNREYHLRYF